MVVVLLGSMGLALTAIWCMLNVIDSDLRPWAAKQVPEPEGLVQGARHDGWLALIGLQHGHLDDTQAQGLRSWTHWNTKRQAAKHEPHLPIPGTYELKPNSRVKFNGKTYFVVLCSARDVLLSDETGQQSTHALQAILAGHQNGIVELDQCAKGVGDISFADVPPDELQRALEKLDAIRSGKDADYSARSIARFRGAIAQAGNDVEAILALVDSRRHRGNRKSRISDANKALIEKAIAKHYNDGHLSTDALTAVMKQEEWEAAHA
jgi:hypothetical protein